MWYGMICVNDVIYDVGDVMRCDQVKMTCHKPCQFLVKKKKKINFLFNQFYFFFQLKLKIIKENNLKVERLLTNHKLNIC